MNENGYPARHVPAELSRRRFVEVAAAATGALAAGAGLFGSATASADRGSGVVNWIDRCATPVGTTPDGPLFDMYPLRSIVGDARIVGLGYGAHGTHTLTTLHHRAIRFLVEYMGFRTVAWEESWGVGVEIDRYVADGGGDPAGAREVVGNAFPIVRHEAIVDLVRWLSEFNVGRPARDKVRFLGTDVTEVHEFLYERVTQYVTDVAPERLPELNEHLDPLRMHGTPQETVLWFVDPARTEDWRDEMTAHGLAMFDIVKSLPDRPSSVERLDAIQDAENICGFFHFLSWKGTIADVREVYISETINRWMKRVPNRTVYVAHNGHVGANPRMLVSIPPFDMNRSRELSGSFLRRDYGRSYVPIGSCFDHGQVFVGWQAETGPRVYDIPSADPSFLDHTLSQARYPAYLLNLNAPGEAAPEIRQWLDGPAKIRFIASPYVPANDGDYKQVNDPFRNAGFAAMFYVDQVETARMFNL